MSLLRVGAILLTVSAFQPSLPSQSRGTLIVGQVIDVATGRPAGGAIVAMASPQLQPAQVPRVLTGTDGRFVFRDLGPGTYSITATKMGYAEGAYGRNRAGGPAGSLTLAAGDKVGDVAVRLWKHAAIAGAVVDESGEHLVGIDVRAYRRMVVAGRRRFVPAAAGRTDDRGLYRISGLIPGDYIVGTITRQAILPLSILQAAAPGTPARMAAVEAGLGSMDGRDLAVMQTGDVGVSFMRGTPVPPSPVDGRFGIYPATFHPNAVGGEAAALITMRSGEEYLNGDLHITPVPTVRVSGIVLGPDGPVTRGLLRLHPANTAEVFGDGDVPAVATDLAGGFTFPAVPAGHYVIKLARGSFLSGGAPSPGLTWVEAPVTVGNEDVESLALTARPGLTVSGRLEFEGDMSKLRGSLAGVAITIESAEAAPGGTGPIYTARAGTNGEFVSPPVPGGHYFLRVPNSPPGWMFKSITVDGRDAADTPVALASDLPNVVVTFTDKWSGVRGAVQTAAGRDPAALVIVFPTDRDTWGSSGQNPRRVRSTRPSRTGEYSLNLPPGDYYVAAISDEFSSDWQDPDFLDRVSRFAARITIGDGERRVQDLRTREAR